MSIGTQIKKARQFKRLTQQALADKVGITAGAIGNYENGTSSPREEILIALMDALDIDANYVFQDSMPITSISRSSPSDWSTPLVNAYQDAKRSTREAACNVLQIPYVDVEDESEPVTVPTAHFACAAGIPVWVGDGDMDDKAYPSGVVPHGTSFAIHIAGDSMEPTIPDGAYVFIKQQPDLQNREIGVFMLHDEATCKRYYKDKNGVKLISDNLKYDPIRIDPNTEGFGLVGKVLGHYVEDN